MFLTVFYQFTSSQSILVISHFEEHKLMYGIEWQKHVEIFFLIFIIPYFLSTPLYMFLSYRIYWLYYTHMTYHLNLLSDPFSISYYIFNISSIFRHDEVIGKKSLHHHHHHQHRFLSFSIHLNTIHLDIKWKLDDIETSRALCSPVQSSPQ